MPTIPLGWLIRPIEVQEVEDQLATEGAPDAWLEQWRIFLGHALPADELWEFFAVEVSDPFAEEPCGCQNYRDGYALVRDGGIVDTIGAPGTW